MTEEEKIDDEEETEVEVTEITLSEDEIDEWIGKLEELKDSKKEIEISLDSENDLLIKYEENEEDESD